MASDSDEAAATIDRLRKRLSSEQRELLERLWGKADERGNVPARVLFHKLRPSSAVRSLESLGGSLVVEVTGIEECYVLTLLGALVGPDGEERERLLASLLAYEVSRYDDDMNLKELTREELERDLRMQEPASLDVFRLATMPGSRLTSGSSGGPNWKLTVPRNLHYLTEVTDWRHFVRQHALEGYDPTLPVRAAARETYTHDRFVAETESAALPEFWDRDKFRLFISHVTAQKTVASAIQSSLHTMHVSSFVAHVDIEPTKEWEDEILAALRSTEALVALLTSDFHASKWTDQEVGFAMGREQLVVSVAIDGPPPHGFIARSQAINGHGRSPEEIAHTLFDALAKHESTRQRIAEVVVAHLEQSPTFQDAEANLALFTRLGYMDHSLASRARAACDSNGQIRLFATHYRERFEDVLKRWAL